MFLVRFLNPVLMIALGLGVGAVLVGRKPDGWRFYFVGVLTFILSQVLHIPFNLQVLNPWLESFSDQGDALLIVSVLLGLSAGVFEEFARYLAYRFAARDARDWRSGLMMGAGHGGIEAVLLGLVALYTVMQLTVLRSQDAAAFLGEAQLDQLVRVQAQVTAFWALPWYAVLLGSLERLFAICFHLSASVLVLQVFRRKQLFWLGLAVLWHTALDAVAVFVSSRFGIYWAEAVLGLMALASVGIILALRSSDDEGALPPPVEQELLDLGRAEVSREQVDSSRYD